jgi:hypothetical protein
MRFGAKRPPGPQYSSGGPGTGTSTRGVMHRPCCSICGHFRKFVCIKLNNAGNRRKPLHGRRARADPRRNDGGRRASWPDDSLFRSTRKMSQQFFSTVTDVLQCSKFMETAFSRGRRPAIVSCAFAPNRLRRGRDWETERIQGARGCLALRALVCGKLFWCSILYRPLLAISGKLVAVRAAIARRLRLNSCFSDRRRKRRAVRVRAGQVGGEGECYAYAAIAQRDYHENAVSSMRRLSATDGRRTALRRQAPGQPHFRLQQMR